VVGYLIRWKGSFLELFLVGFYLVLVLKLKFGLTSTSIVGSKKKIFITDLVKVVKQARAKDKDIILTGDFNELVGDDPNQMAKVLQEGCLTDVYRHQHGEVDINTYTQGHKRLDMSFVTPRLVKHILRSGYKAFHA
jgi:hypothetical protein